MDPEEHLRKVKQQLDNAVVIALENLHTPGMEGLRMASEPVKLAYEYRNALMAAAETASTEVAEHYRLLASHAVPKAEFLMSAIVGYRGKHNIM